MISYQDIYKNLIEKLIASETNDTKTLTFLIKEFFHDTYKSFHIAGFGGRSEFLFDIAVLSCDPKDVHKNTMADYKLHVAVESELGGTSASSSKNVELNVILDFSKLLYANAIQKILIGAYSIPNNRRADESGELDRLVSKLAEINNKSNNDVDVLAILVKGDHTSGNSRQIKICLPIEINGFILKKNKSHNRLANPSIQKTVFDDG